MSTPRTQRGSTARKMWEYERISYSEMYAHKSERATVPVAVVDCRPEAREALEALIAKAIARSEGERRGYKINAQCYLEASRAALTALLGKMAK